MEGSARSHTWFLVLVTLLVFALPQSSLAGPIQPGTPLLLDPNLQQCLDEALVGNGWTTTEEVVELACRGRQVSELIGIENLPNLQRMDLADNLITDPVPLDALVQLQELDLSNNRLADVFVLQTLQNLQRLYLSGNRALTPSMLQPVIANNSGLTHLGVGGIAIGDLNQLPIFAGPPGPYALLELDVSDTGLVDLVPLNQLSTLQTLRAADNRLVDTAPLDQLLQLQTLDLSGNQLINAHLNPLQQLQALDLSDNRLLDLGQMQELDTLQQLYLGGNPALTLNTVQPVISSNSGLTHLGLGGIAIDDLNQLPIFTGPTGPYALVELDLNDTGIADLGPLAQVPDLQVLRSADNTLISAAPLNQLPQLQVLDLSRNQLVDVAPLQALANLQRLSVTGNPALTPAMLQPVIVNNPGLTHLGLGGIALADLNQLPIFTEPGGAYALVELDVSDTGLTDLLPLNQLPTLQVLRAADNQLIDTAALDQLPQLQVLDLSHNALTDTIQLPALQNLQQLYLTGNTALSLSMVHPVIVSNPSLTHLGLGGIAIGDLNQLPIFGGPPGAYPLVELDVSDAGLSDLWPLNQLATLQVLRAADNQLIDTTPLDQLLQLRELDLSGNQLAFGNLNPLQELRVLDLSHNRLADVASLQSLHNLQQLYLSGNTALSLTVVHPVIASNPGLTHLGLGGIAIDDLNQLPIFAGPTGPYGLVELDVSDSGLSDLWPLDQFPGLRVLRAADNQLIDATPLNQLPQLRVLDLRRNGLPDVTPLQTLADLQELYLSGNPALTLPMLQPLIAINPGLTHLGLGGIAIGDLSQLSLFGGPGGPYRLVELDVSATGLVDLGPLNQLPSLEVLKAANNQLIGTEPLDQLPRLRVLDLSHNQLSNLVPLPALQNLRQLYLTGNPALTLPMVHPLISTNPGLTHLGVGGIAIGDLNQLPVFGGPYPLIELDVSNTGLIDLWSLQQLPTLEVLRAADNGLIDTAPLDQLQQLRVLDLSGNRLATAYLNPLQQLQVLDLSDNQLTDLLQVQDLQNLRELYVTGNDALTPTLLQPLIDSNPGLTRLGVGGIALGDLNQLPIFAGPYQLIELDMNDTGVADLWPLNQFPTLQVLRAADNQLSDSAPLDQLRQLRVLDLSGNQLPYVTPLESLKALRELYLSGNDALTPAMVQPLIINNPGLTHLGLGGIAIGDLGQLPLFGGPPGAYDLIELDVTDTGLVDLWPLDQFPTLRVLRAAHNQLVDTGPLDQLPALRVLDLSHNQLASLTPLPELQSLRELYLTGNGGLLLGMVYPVIANNPGLTHLGVGGIAIGDLNQLPVFAGPSGGPYGLVELDVSDAGLVDLWPLTQLATLQVLRAADNQTPDVNPLGQLSELRSLDLSNSQVQLVNLLADIPYMEFLDLRGNTGIQCADLDLLDAEWGTAVVQRPMSCAILTPPELLILAPQGPEILHTTDSIAFVADASDVEDGDLDAQVQWSSSLDGFLGAGSPLNRSLSAGQHVITATVTDSHGNTTEASVTLQVLPNTLPALTLLTPLDGAVINSGGLAILGADAVDAEEGDIGWQVQWSSNLNGLLGSGATIQVQISEAPHLITATVTDSTGASVAQSVSIVIGPFQDSDDDSLSDYEETCFDGDCNAYDPYHPVNNPTGTDTDILSADTDQDGYRDVTEIGLGSDPLNAASTPDVVADGDINLDGQTNAADVLLAQRYTLGLSSLSPEQIDHGDYRPLPDGDGDLNTADLVLITQAALNAN